MILLPPETAPVTGVRAPTCRGEPAPYLLPPLPSLTTSTPLSRARKAPTGRAVGTPRSSAPGAPGAAHSALFCAPPAPALAVAPRTRARETGAWAGRTARRSRAPSAGTRQSLKTRRRPKTSRTRKESKKFTHQLADWEHGERPQGRVIATSRPEVDGAPRPSGRVFPREEVPQQPRLRQRNRVRVLVHLEDA
jgi:hypothetical protein